MNSCAKVGIYAIPDSDVTGGGGVVVKQGYMPGYIANISNMYYQQGEKLRESQTLSERSIFKL